MTPILEQTALEPQIAQLEAEISKRQTDIKNLEEAIATLKSGKPRPSNPSVDDTFALLKELVGGVPKSLEEQAIYAAKLSEAERSLELAITACREKETELKSLRALQSTQQEEQAFEQLKSKAAEFNSLIDNAIALLDEMRGLSLARGRFEIVCDLNEAPYCRVGSDRIVVRRRFDVKR